MIGFDQMKTCPRLSINKLRDKFLVLQSTQLFVHFLLILTSKYFRFENLMFVEPSVTNKWHVAIFGSHTQYYTVQSCSMDVHNIQQAVGTKTKCKDPKAKRIW